MRNQPVDHEFAPPRERVVSWKFLREDFPDRVEHLGDILASATPVIDRESSLLVENRPKSRYPRTVLSYGQRGGQANILVRPVCPAGTVLMKVVQSMCQQVEAHLVDLRITGEDRIELADNYGRAGLPNVCGPFQEVALYFGLVPELNGGLGLGTLTFLGNIDLNKAHVTGIPGIGREARRRIKVRRVDDVR